MAIAMWLKTKDSRTILRSFEGKKQIVVVHAYHSWIGAQEGYHLVVLVVHNRKIPSIGPAQTIVGIDWHISSDHCWSK